MAGVEDYARAAVTALNERRYDEAISQFEQALKLAPDRPDLVNALGLAHMNRGDVATAIEHLERSVELAKQETAPDSERLRLHTHLTLARALDQADRVQDARRVLEAAISTWPGRAEARVQLGQILLGACLLDDGLALYREVAAVPGLPKEVSETAEAIVGSVAAFQDSGHPASTFLKAHAESYRQYFDDSTKDSVASGWYLEAARMARGPNGEPKPLLPQGARPYALQRVDLVNPADGSVASVYSEQEPMIVALNGLEPMAQLSILLPWQGQPFATWVSTRCPWHWLSIAVQFATVAGPGELLAELDAVIGDWYLAGFNGDFGDRELGRFHFITDPEPVGDRAIAYTVDLGRARFDAIDGLMKRLAILHERRPIRRVLFGQGRLPE